jgi:hypothetical protein
LKNNKKILPQTRLSSIKGKFEKIRTLKIMIEEIKVPKIRIESKRRTHSKKSTEIVNELIAKRAGRRCNR